MPVEIECVNDYNVSNGSVESLPHIANSHDLPPHHHHNPFQNIDITIDFHHNHLAANNNNIIDSTTGMPPLIDARESQLPASARLVSASAGAILTSLVVTPLDVVKTRLQSQFNPLQSPASSTSPPSSPSNAAAAIGATLRSSGSSPSYYHHHHHPSLPARFTHAFFAPDPLLHNSSHVQVNLGLVDIWCEKCPPTYHMPHTFRYTPSTSSASSTNIPNEFHPRYNGPLDVVRKMVANEGFFSLWRGLTPTLLMSIPSTVVYFAAYDYLRLSLTRHKTIANSDTLLTLTPLLAGTSARAAATVLVSPIELIRTRAQASTSRHLREHGASTGMKSILKDELSRGGIRSLWRGAGPTLWRDVPFSAVYWSSYENLKAYLYHKFQGRSSGANVSVISYKGRNSKRDLVFSSFLSGSISGMLAAALTHPFDLVKTRRQIDMYQLTQQSQAQVSPSNHICTNPDHHHHPHRHAVPTSTTLASSSSSSMSPSTTSDVLRTIVKQEGLKGLTSGILPRIAKIAPACAIMISSYEFAKIVLADRDGSDGIPPNLRMETN